MAANSKFELSSGSSDGLMYPSGQRGSYAAALLDRSSSFCEGMDNRPSVLPGMSRGGSSLSHGDMMNFLQFLPFDAKAAVADHKLPRQGELKRVITAALGFSPDDACSGAFCGKPLPPSSQDELRHVRASLVDSTIRARDRMKTLEDTVSKFDKFPSAVLSRKRARSDVSSSERSNTLLSGEWSGPGGSMNKMGSHNHILSSHAYEAGSQKSEDRSKNAVPNKRVRTSMVDVRMDARANGLTRPLGSIDKERHSLKLGNGTAIQSEEKSRTLSAGVDGWEKSKMRKKRSGIKSDASAGTNLTRGLDNDQETKRATQQRLGGETRLKFGDSHGFRSGYSNGAVGVGKLDVTSQQNGLGPRSATRSEQDNFTLPNDRRDRPVGSEKERITLKAVNKPNIREDSAASSTAVTKINVSTRAPRSSAGAMPKSSTVVRRSIGTPDEWEHPQSTNKPPAIVGENNRKRTSSVRSSSPPVAQWVGQRPQKITRVARRTNFIPVLPGQDEIPSSDASGNVAATNSSLGFPRRMPTNASQLIKPKGDHMSAESEESAGLESKSKDKSKRSGEAEEKVGPVGHKVATLVLSSRKSKAATDEDVGDVIRRQGRTGRGLSHPRSSMSPTMEKLDNAATVKQLRSVRLGSDKLESKAGRPPTKKLMERKAYTRPRHVMNGTLDFTGESDNDHEELLAATNAAMDTSHACSNTFWRQLEPVFGFVSADDASFLKEQGDLGCSSLPSTPSHSRDGGMSQNGVLCKSDMGRPGEMKLSQPLFDQATPGIDVERGLPLSLRIIAAMIEEEDFKDSYCAVSPEEEHLRNDGHVVGYNIDIRLKSESLYQKSVDKFLGVGRTTCNGSLTPADHSYLDDLQCNYLEPDHGMVDPSNDMDTSFANTINGIGSKSSAVPDMICTEFQYKQMPFDERIFMELQSIGITPENVGEDDEMSEEIQRLEERLHGQVSEKKSMLMKLEKAVTEASEIQQRELERLALDKLVRMAYEKYMAYRSASVGKNNTKITKYSVLPFVKRVLARCQKFEVSGKSCFSELTFKDVFSSVSSQSFDREPDMVAEAPLDSDGICLNPQPGLKIDAQDKDSDASNTVNQFPEQTFVKEETWSNRVKRRELSLDDVGNATGTPLRTTSGIGSSLPSGTKGKRSDRDRDGKVQNKEGLSRNSTAKVGRPALGNVKGERKSKAKPKQKTTQLSASVSGLLKASELPKTSFPPVSKSCDVTFGGNSKKDVLGSLPSTNRSSVPETFDLSHLLLPEMDVVGVTDLDGQGQDLASWLNIDDEGLQDNDFVGLDIPMDDLSELNMSFQT